MTARLGDILTVVAQLVLPVAGWRVEVDCRLDDEGAHCIHYDRTPIRSKLAFAMRLTLMAINHGGDIRNQLLEGRLEWLQKILSFIPDNGTLDEQCPI